MNSRAIMVKGVQTEDSREQWEVERIEGKKIKDGLTLYKVKWAGVPESDSTWEPLSHLEGCMALVEQYDLLPKLTNKCAKKTIVEHKEVPEPTETATIEMAAPESVAEPSASPPAKRPYRVKPGSFASHSVKEVTRGLKEDGHLSFEVSWQKLGRLQPSNSIVPCEVLAAKEPRLLALFLIQELRI